MKIFLSYGRDANAPLVERIREDLATRGHEVWIDRHEIKGGDDWRREITKSIYESQLMLAFLSRHSTRDPGGLLQAPGDRTITPALDDAVARRAAITRKIGSTEEAEGNRRSDEAYMNETRIGGGAMAQTPSQCQLFEVRIDSHKFKSFGEALAYVGRSPPEARSRDGVFNVTITLMVVTRLVFLRFDENKSSLLTILNAFAQDIDSAAIKYRDARWVPKHSLEDMASGKVVRAAKVYVAAKVTSIAGAIVGAVAFGWWLMKGFSGIAGYVFLSGSLVSVLGFAVYMRVKTYVEE